MANKKKKRVPFRRWTMPPGQSPLSITPAERKIIELMEAARLAGLPEIGKDLQKELAARLEKRLSRRREKGKK